MFCFGACQEGVDSLALFGGGDTEHRGGVIVNHQETLAKAVAVFAAQRVVELCELAGDFVGTVAFIEFEVGRALEQLAHTLVFFHTGEFQKNLAVVILQHLDVGRYNAICVDTAAEHVGRGVVNTVLDFRFKRGGYLFVALAGFYNRAEHHREIGAVVELAVLVYECAHVVRRVVAPDNRVGVGKGLVECRVGICVFHGAEHVGHGNLKNHVHTAFEVESETHAPLLHFVVVVAQPDGLLAD